MAVISNQANYSNCRVLGRKGPTYTPSAEILSSRALSGADTLVLSGNCVPTAPDGSPPHRHQRRKDPRHVKGGREPFPIPKMLQTNLESVSAKQLGDMGWGCDVCTESIERSGFVLSCLEKT